MVRASGDGFSTTLAAAQKAATVTPYIDLIFTSKDGLTTKNYSTDQSRLLSLDHQEEAYNEYALILLRDNDNTIPYIGGYWTEIGYGCVTGSGNEHCHTARLYVKHQQHISAGGKLYTLLELEGMWAWMQEKLLLLGDAPLYLKDYPTVSNETIYDLIALIMTSIGFTLDALPSPDDGIIDTLIPDFTVNYQPYEYYQQILYRLIRMTKMYLRPLPTLHYELVYPQSADAVNQTYYSNQAHYFYELNHRRNVLVPNTFVVYAEQLDDGTWAHNATAASVGTDEQTITEMALAPKLTVQADVDNYAAAMLARAKAEQSWGKLIVPHDSSVELYDKVAASDVRGGSVTYPSDSMIRVGGLRHIYKPGEYKLEIAFGGLSNTSEVGRAVHQVALMSQMTADATADAVQEAAKREGLRTGPEYAPLPTPVNPPLPPTYPYEPGISRPSVGPEAPGATGFYPYEPGVKGETIGPQRLGGTGMYPYEPGIPPVQPTPVSPFISGVKAGIEFMAKPWKELYRRVTPWSEQKGETLKSWIKGWFD